MRKLTRFLTGLGLVIPIVAVGDATYEKTPSDSFILSLLTTYSKSSSCREEFDPMKAVSQFPGPDGKTRKWEEPDHKEPGVENHLMEWRFPGVTLTSSTHFMYYGPSTWLHSIQLATPVDLPPPIRIGQPVSEVAIALSVSENKIRSKRMWYAGASVTFDVDENDNIHSVLLECIAD